LYITKVISTFHLVGIDVEFFVYLFKEIVIKMIREKTKTNKIYIFFGIHRILNGANSTTKVHNNSILTGLATYTICVSIILDN